MARGRKALPDEVKQAKGNPGKRPLHLRPATGEATAIAAPAFLTSSDEKAIFKRIVDQLDQLRFIRATDVAALGRWAAYLARWAKCKRALDGKEVYYETASKHGTMLRIHPIFATMVQAERLMVPLEDRLGLNVQARQMIVKGIFQAPRPTDGEGLFGVTEPSPTPADEAPATPESPLGFLNTAATRH